jgi:hypothetical protein
MESTTPNSDSFLWHDLFKDAVLHCDVDKISPSMLITSEDDKTYLASLSQLECETILADWFDQFKRAEELRLALEVSQQSGDSDEVPFGNEEVAQGSVGNPNVPKGDVPATNVEMLEVADSMKILSATTVTGGGRLNVATNNIQKVSHQPKKPAARKSRAKEVVKNKVVNYVPKLALRLRGDMM